MRRFRLLLIAVGGAALLAGLGTDPSSGTTSQAVRRASTGTPTFVISGRGWGHGVGMAQWGAYGFAQQGSTYDEILAHYYTGTTLGPAPVSSVRVLLSEGRRTLTVSSLADFRVRDATGQTYELAAGAQSIGTGLRVKPRGEQQRRSLTGPVVFSAGSSPLRLAGRPYRGQLQVSVANGSLRAVNFVGLEGYLFGVVPSEMPHSWASEALKAQAVAARSYALAVRRTGSYFDLYPDTRSQVYSGIAAEKPSTTAAIQETAGQVVLYEGRLVKTYFFSSSGGRTASVADAWPGSPPLPYLVSVDDPYDTLSPHHDWGPITVGARRLGQVLRVRGRLLDVRSAVGPSSRVRTVTAVGSLGDSSVSGADVRRALGLRSTWFRIGVLSLAPPEGPVTFGGQIALTGLARRMPAVSLQQRQAGSPWRQVRQVRPARDGTVTVGTRPSAPSDFRLASGSARSRVAHVAVAPLVRFRGVGKGSTLRGFARPLFPGARVSLQRLEGNAWTTVDRATIDANGDFTANFSLVQGTYRARLAPGRGFVPGVSPVVRVGPA